jgi:nucleolar GTP-binding protein
MEEDDEESSGEEAIRSTASLIRKRKAEMKMASHSRKDKAQNRPTIPRKFKTQTLSEMAEGMKAVGLDPGNLEERARLLAKAKGIVIGEKRKSKKGLKRGEDEEEMEVDDDEDDEEVGFEEGGDWKKGMEVDGEGVRDRIKRAGGSIVPKGKRLPRKDRVTMALKDEMVSALIISTWSLDAECS